MLLLITQRFLWGGCELPCGGYFVDAAAPSCDGGALTEEGIMKQSAKPLNMLIINASSRRPLTASQGTFKMLSGRGGGGSQRVCNHQRGKLRLASAVSQGGINE